MHPVAAGIAGEPCTVSTHTGCSIRFELCISQYVVHPLNHNDLQFSLDARYRCRDSCMRNLRSFACHRTDEIKTVGKKFVSYVTILGATPCYDMLHASPNKLLIFFPTNQAPRTNRPSNQRFSLSKMKISLRCAVINIIVHGYIYHLNTICDSLRK